MTAKPSTVILCTAGGDGVRATARIPGLSKDSVNNVILKAGHHAGLVMGNLLKNLHLNECQMAELWAFVNKKSLSEEDPANQSGQSRIWTAIDADSRLILRAVVGQDIGELSRVCPAFKTTHGKRAAIHQ